MSDARPDRGWSSEAYILGPVGWYPFKYRLWIVGDPNKDGAEWMLKLQRYGKLSGWMSKKKTYLYANGREKVDRTKPPKGDS